MGAGARVPMGYVLPISAQAAIAAENQVSELGDFRRIDRLPRPVIEDIEQILQMHPELAFVARSSSTTEDLPFASAAGQYDSFLHLRSVEETVEGLLATYRVLGDPDLAGYLRHHGVDPGTQLMAALLQAMVLPIEAGVLYTEAPLDRSFMRIEYVHGLGTEVVGGSCTPIHLSWSRGSPPPSTLAAELTAVGLMLEKEFGAPQDIEWGWTEEGLVIFQSRHIIRPIARGTRSFPALPSSGTKVQSVAGGVVVGRLEVLDSAVPVGSDGFCGGIAAATGASGQDVRRALLRGYDGLVLGSGGQLSHIASVCREWGVVAVVAEPELVRRYLGSLIVLDGDAATLLPMAELDPVQRKGAVFDWARLQAARGRPGYREKRLVEAVIVDQSVVRRCWAKLNKLTAGVAPYVQGIEPFDFEPRVYCGVSARIQSSPDKHRIQFKYVDACADRPYRQDHEVHLSIRNPQEGRKVLEGLGYLPRPPQERLIVRIPFEGAVFQFNYWPGAKGVYLGVEVAEEAMLARTLALAEVPLKATASLDGVDLFQRFEVSLTDCQFRNQPPAFEKLVGAWP
jgi:hypothetical protein